MMNKVVFLDRDGVINRPVIRDGRSYPPASVADLVILDGVPEALHQMRDAGFDLVVVTNQPDVARGTQSRAAVEAIHAELRRRLPLDDIRTCYHDDAEQCGCRKPKPGLLTEGGPVDFARSFMVGDRWRDIAAGAAAGCRTVFLDYGYRERQPDQADFKTGSLLQAAEWICKQPMGDTMSVESLKVKIFADGADRDGMIEMAQKSYIKGLTTNPTLMAKVGIKDYRQFAKDILKEIKTLPISFEVFSDDFKVMEQQALEIASWGDNVYVKIPVTNTKREPSYDLVHRLSSKGVKLNVTAMMTLDQVLRSVQALDVNTPACISVFAGRIADTGLDPLPLMAAAVQILKLAPKSELIWASPRELLNIFHADSVGCQIITVTNDILKKLDNIGKDLDEYSLDTVKMFYNDAVKAGFKL